MIIIFNFDKKMESSSINSICQSVIESRIDDINMILATIIYYRKNGNYNGIVVGIAKALWETHYPVCSEKGSLDANSNPWYRKPCKCGSEFKGRLWMYRYYLYFMYKNKYKYINDEGQNRKDYTYKEFRKSVREAIIDNEEINLEDHFVFRKPSNKSPDEVNEFYKKMLEDGVKIIDDGNKKFMYSLL